MPGGHFIRSAQGCHFSRWRLCCTLLWIAMLLATLNSCTSPQTLQASTQRIRKVLSRQQGTFAVAFKDLSTGNEILINEGEVFHAASTMKTPVMIELFRQVKAGRIGLHDSIPVLNRFSSIIDGSLYQLKPEGDSDPKLYERVGQKQPLDTLITRMITVSSNLATNILIVLACPDSVNRTMRKLGAESIQVKRGVEDGPAYEAGINNTTTALDQLRIYEKLAIGLVVDAAASAQMIAILQQQKFNEIIPARLPGNVKVAHKTGSIQGVRHDTGIVELKDGRRYVVVLLSKGIVNEKASVRNMARVSKLLYRQVVRGYKP